MRIYLDVSCLNRPYDDQDQLRIRLETEAVTAVLKQFDRSVWDHVSSEMAAIEINAMPDHERRRRVELLLPDEGALVKLDQAIFDRAGELEALAIKQGDAVHVAAAEAAKADVLLTCDDRFCRAAERNVGKIAVAIMNPLEWLKGMNGDSIH